MVAKFDLFSAEGRGFESKSVTDTRATTDKNDPFLNMGFKHGKKWVDKNGAKCNMGFGRITKNIHKQQEKELAVFRLMGEKCAEKKHRSNNILLNALRKKPAVVMVLQQAKEQELFQSQHASILEHSVTAQQSFSTSHKNSLQVNTPPRRARLPEDVVAIVRPRLGMCTMICVLCERDVAEIDWEKFVKT